MRAYKGIHCFNIRDIPVHYAGYIEINSSSIPFDQTKQTSSRVMIRKQKTKGGKVKITFVLPTDQLNGPVAVVGDFNNWDPYANPLKKRSNGTHSAVITVSAGESYAFRYLADGGQWLDETSADGHVIDEYGNTNCIVEV